MIEKAGGWRTYLCSRMESNGSLILNLKAFIHVIFMRFQISLFKSQFFKWILKIVSNNTYQTCKIWLAHIIYPLKFRSITERSKWYLGLRFRQNQNNINKICIYNTNKLEIKEKKMQVAVLLKSFFPNIYKPQNIKLLNLWISE